MQLLLRRRRRNQQQQQQSGGSKKIRFHVWELVVLILVCTICGIQLLSKLESSSVYYYNNYYESSSGGATTTTTTSSSSSIVTNDNDNRYIDDDEPNPSSSTAWSSLYDSLFSSSFQNNNGGVDDDDDNRFIIIDDDSNKYDYDETKDWWFLLDVDASSQSQSQQHERMKNQNCFYVENVCHASPQIWFYDNTNTNNTNNKNSNNKTNNNKRGSHQPPNLTLRFREKPHHSKLLEKELYNYPTNITILPSYPTATSMMSNTPLLLNCHYSNIYNHVVLHSYFNDMLGEFYARTLLGMYLEVFQTTNTNTNDDDDDDDDDDGRLLPSNTTTATSTTPSSSDSSFLQSLLVQQHTQLYLHLYEIHPSLDPRKKGITSLPTILESHRLFLDLVGVFGGGGKIGVGSNLNSKSSGTSSSSSSSSLTSINPVLNFRTLLDHVDGTTCKCMKRLLFCGYRQVEEEQEEEEVGSNETITTTTTSSMNTTTTTKTNGGGTTKNSRIIYEPIQNIGTNDYSYNKLRAQRNDVEYYGKHWLRQHIVENVKNNVYIQTKIHNMRDVQLSIHNIVPSVLQRKQYRTNRQQQVRKKRQQSSNSNSTTTIVATTTTTTTTTTPTIDDIVDSAIKEWKIIGLLQRTKRRRWYNSIQVKEECNTQLNKYKILCIIINIEDTIWYSPTQHLVAHSMLDGVIGIHGAQLTEAILLPKPLSLVVELLPYIHPQQQYGRWTTETQDGPTPLGIIFDETNLNHIGYPLPIESTKPLYCQTEIQQDLEDLKNTTSPKEKHNFLFPKSKKCFQRNHWDNRDFVISPHVIIDILMKFVVNPPALCDDYTTSAGNEYVLYNVNCVNEKALEVLQRKQNLRQTSIRDVYKKNATVSKDIHRTLYSKSLHNDSMVIMHQFRSNTWVLEKQSIH